jgi:hypothetical protein
VLAGQYFFQLVFFLVIYDFWWRFCVGWSVFFRFLEGRKQVGVEYWMDLPFFW